MLTVTLPWPHRGLSPNARLHWAAKAKLKAEARAQAKYATMQAVYHNSPDTSAFQSGDIRLELEFCPPTARAFDRDNALASCKAALDGVADALGVNDTRFEPIVLRRGEKRPKGAVIVRLGNG